MKTLINDRETPKTILRDLVIHYMHWYAQDHDGAIRMLKSDLRVIREPDKPSVAKPA